MPITRRAFRTTLIVFLVILGICVVAAGNTTASVMRAYVMSSGSMERTLLIGDRFLVRPLVSQTIPRGEMVQMSNPLDESQTWIKRVVAVGGDRIHLRDKALFLNGSAVSEPYVTHSTSYIDSFRDDFPGAPTSLLPGDWADYLKRNVVNGEIVVPQGKYFVLGDNRDNSLDSRYVGFVDRQQIIGKPVFIYLSIDSTHGFVIRWNRMFKGL